METEQLYQLYGYLAIAEMLREQLSERSTSPYFLKNIQTARSRCHTRESGHPLIYCSSGFLLAQE